MHSVEKDIAMILVTKEEMKNDATNSMRDRKKAINIDAFLNNINLILKNDINTNASHKIIDAISIVNDIIARLSSNERAKHKVMLTIDNPTASCGK